jgi:hypothetical protein
MHSPLNVKFEDEVVHVTCRGVGRKGVCVGSFRRGKPEENTRLERYLHRYEDSIKTGRKEMGKEGLGSLHLTQDRHS